MAKPGSKDIPKQAALLTVSDGCFHGKRQDRSGQDLRQALQEAGWPVAASAIVPDQIDRIQQQIRTWSADPQISLIVTTGGTGLAPRDLTPEAVTPLLDKQIPGLSELMRLRGLEKTPLAALSRSLAGTIGKTLILCLPGSPKGAVESLQAILEILPHAVDIAQGKTGH
ncbi:MAG: MogA/MoaB family molybdenum cofactor biosynthesis protein [Acidobacteriota bacterium]